MCVCARARTCVMPPLFPKHGVLYLSLLKRRDKLLDQAVAVVVHNGRGVCACRGCGGGVDSHRFGHGRDLDGWHTNLDRQVFAHPLVRQPLAVRSKGQKNTQAAPSV